ncbi:MAG: DnaD domain protein [Clostridium sp.]|nr:DnaD domain protein [Clostridium sp.]
MSTFMLKNKQLDFTPVSNIFIEKYMPKARGEFIKVYLLMLKYNTCGEMGVTSSILATSLNLLESDVLNALNYWNDEGLIKLIPIDKMGNFNIEFVDLVKESKSQSKEINLLQALNKNSTKDMLNDIERLLGRPLSPKEMTTYLSWQDDFNFSSELILILFEYCVSRGKSDYRYIEKVAIAWKDMNISTIEQAQNYIKRTEDKWIKIRHILNYLGIKNPELMKPQEDMLDKWINDFKFPLDVIEKACNICFQRLNRADFKYIDGILSNWNKNNLKTIAAIEEKDSKPSTAIQGKGNYTSNNSKRFTGQNINNKSSKDYDDLEKELLGWYNND